MTEHKPVPPYDYTRTERSRRRKAQLNGIAQAHGFPSWSALETACINGAALAVGQAGAQAVEVDDPDALAAIASGLVNANISRQLDDERRRNDNRRYVADHIRADLDNPAQHPR